MTTTTEASEWLHPFYQPNPTSPPPSAGRHSDAMVVSTTITTSTTPPPNSRNTTTTDYSLNQVGLGGIELGSGSGLDSFLGSSNASPTTVTTAIGRLSPAQEGRVSRPARRRSRASRRNPTTLLNTDTTNFRAMVQRYTGGASAYSPFDSPAGFALPGCLQPGPMYNFNQPGSVIPGTQYLSSATIEPQASHLRQQLLQQYGGINASSAAPSAVGHRVVRLGLEEEGVSSLSHVGPRAPPGSDHYSASIGGGENRRGGLMF